MRDRGFRPAPLLAKEQVLLAAPSAEMLLSHSLGYFSKVLVSSFGSEMTHSILSGATWSSQMPAVISVCISRQGEAQRGRCSALQRGGGGDKGKHSLNKEGEPGRGDRKRNNASPCKRLNTYYFSAASMSISARFLTPSPAHHPSPALPLSQSITQVSTVKKK